MKRHIARPGTELRLRMITVCYAYCGVSSQNVLVVTKEKNEEMGGHDDNVCRKCIKLMENEKLGISEEDAKILKQINRHRCISSEIDFLLQTYRDTETENNDKIYGSLAERVAQACEDIVHKHRSAWHEYSLGDRRFAEAEIVSARKLFVKVVPEGYISGYIGKVITEIPF